MRWGALAAWLVGLLVLIRAPDANATDWITRIPRVGEGPGVKVGQRTRFHPGFAAVVGFDSNVFRTRNGEAPPRQAAYTTPSLWLRLGNQPVRDGVLDSAPKPTDSKFDYSIAVGAGYRLYMTGDPQVFQAGKFNADVQARFMALPGRRVSFFLNEDLSRFGQPRNFEAGADVNFNRINHDAALGFIWRPGGGRLNLSLAYQNHLLYLEAPDLPTADRIANGVEQETKWRFRDRSALVVRYRFTSFYHFCCVDLGIGRNEDSEQHRLWGGYVGQVGKRWAIEALGGWGWGLYKDDPNGPSHRNFIGRGAITFFPRPTLMFRVAGERSFADASFGNYITDVGGRFDTRLEFRWRMRFIGGVQAGQRRWAGLPVPGLETDQIESYVNAPGFVREDFLLGAHAQLEQPFGKVFVLALRYNFWWDDSDTVVNFVDGSFDILGYRRQMVMLIGAVRY